MEDQLIIFCCTLQTQLFRLLMLEVESMFVQPSYVDLCKAFDSLDHCLLLECLFDFGVCGIELQWFSNYLSNCKQWAKCGS